MNIAIIGVGSLGYRHLQSMYELKDLCTIYAVEINEALLKRYREEMPDVSYISDISDLPEEIEVAVIATNSIVRRIVFEKLVEQRTVKSIIFEKVLFQKEEDYYYVNDILNEYGICAWVNCARREWDSYKKLKEELSSCREMHISMVGGEWGLGCNGIHMLDLIEYLSESQIENISTDRLENIIVPSKREGFYEFYGTITGMAGKCKDFCISCIKDSQLPFCIIITTETALFIIEEGRVIHILSRENNWKYVERDFSMTYQSQMTGRVIRSIIDKGTCNLASYKESMSIHLKYLSELFVFLGRNGMEGERCPIT